MVEVKICPACGHILDVDQTTKHGDKIWVKGVHYIIATVDVNVEKDLIGIQLIDPDDGTRYAQHPVYVKNANDISERELQELLVYNGD